MFTDLANMYREHENAEQQDAPDFSDSFNAEETARMFTGIMSNVFGQQDLDLAAKIFTDTLIRKGRKPSFWIKDEATRKKAEGLSRIP